MTSKEVWRKSDKGLLRGLFFLVWEGKWADDPESGCVLIPAELAFACGDWFICVGGVWADDLESGVYSDWMSQAAVARVRPNE